LPPTAALKINDALSAKIFVTSCADFVYIAFDKSVIWTAGYESCIAFIILLHYSFNLMHVKEMFLSLNSFIKSSSFRPSGDPSG
jgi:hypothetical protein